MNKERVVVGLSGGVDSSVAAGLLVEQGFDVIGITIKTYNYEEVGGNSAGDSSCCSLDGINDARTVCHRLGIPHYVVDFSERFRETVIDDFIASYLAGNTPNPCVVCNRTIKWEELIRKGLALGATHVAMGHYAAVRHDERSGRYWISRGADRTKDQSYALWAVTQESLARTILPLASLSKREVREHAFRFGFRNASKAESFEICFIPDDNYARYLGEAVPGLRRSVVGGEVMFGDKVVGTHAGYPFYTIGQRRGLNVALGEPVFVKEIDAEHNRLLVGRGDELYHRLFSVRGVNLMKYAALHEPLRVTAKIRYKDDGAPALLRPGIDGRIEVAFDEPRRAITPGQSTVWYEGDDVVGGGIIERVME